MHCVTEVKAVLAMSESTCQTLCYSGKDCLRSVRTYLPGTCVAGVQTVSAMSEPTCGALCCRGADCLSSLRTYLPELCYSGAGWLGGVGTYLPGTVLQWCRLLKQCQNLPAGYCVTGVQSVEVVMEPTYQALCYSDAGCLSGVRTYLPGTVLQWCRLLKLCRNLFVGHCVTGVQAV